MPFVKLDTGILNSTLWVDRDVTQIFITALLMAEPFEVQSPMEQLEVRNLKVTGFTVPPGWYGLVPAAGVGIIRRALMEQEAGYVALEKLGSAESESRSNDFDGRRLVRVDGGYIVLNYMKYRDRDYTAAERQKRWRERQKGNGVTRNCNEITRYITQAEAEAEAEAEKNKENLSSDELFALSPKPLTFDPEKVFQYFCEKAEKSKAYLFTDKRKKQCTARWVDALKIAAGDIKSAKNLMAHAIDALIADSFMQDNGYVEWEQIFRSTDQFTKWIEIYDKPRRSQRKA
jgi:hypothetical protein